MGVSITHTHVQVAAGGRRAVVVHSGEDLVLDLGSLVDAGVIEIQANLRLIATLEPSDSPTITIEGATLRALGRRVSIVFFRRGRAVVHARSTLDARPHLAIAWLEVRMASRSLADGSLLAAACASDVALGLANLWTDDPMSTAASTLAVTAVVATVLSTLWAWRVGLESVRHRWRALVATALLASSASWSLLPSEQAVDADAAPAQDSEHVRRAARWPIGSNGVSPVVSLDPTTAEQLDLWTRNVVAIPVRSTHRTGAGLQFRGTISMDWGVEDGATTVLVPWAFLPVDLRSWQSSKPDAQLILTPEGLVLHALAPRWAREGDPLEDSVHAHHRDSMSSLGVSDWSGRASLEVRHDTQLVRLFDDEQLGRAPRLDDTVGFTRCPEDLGPRPHRSLVSRIWNVPASRALAIVADESTRRTVGSWSPSERDDAHVWAVICHAVRVSSWGWVWADAHPAFDETTRRVRPIAVLVGALGNEGGPTRRATLVPRLRRGSFDGFELRYDEDEAVHARAARRATPRS